MLYKIILILLVFIPFQVFSADLDTTVTEAFELYSVSNFTEAAPMFEEAYYMAKKNSAKDISSRFRTSLYAGLSYRGIGEYAQAKAWFLVSLALAEKVQDLYDIPTLIAYVAESARLAGDIHEAETYYTKALMYDDLTDKDKAVLYYGLAETNRLSEQYHLSKENCDKALDYATGLKLQKILSSCDIIYGEFYRTHKDYAKAMFYFSRAADTSRARKYADILVPALNGMGLTSEALHRPDAAREYFEQSFFVALENGAVDNTDIIYKKIMDYMPEKGSFKYQGDKSYELAGLEFLDDDTSLLLYSLSALYYRLGSRYVELYTAAEAGYNLAENLSNSDMAAEFIYDMALSLYHAKEYEECAARSEEAVSRLKSTNKRDLLSDAYYIQAESYYNLGYYKQAYSSMNKAISYAKLTDHERLYKRLNEIKAKADK